MWLMSDFKVGDTLFIRFPECPTRKEIKIVDICKILIIGQFRNNKLRVLRVSDILRAKKTILRDNQLFKCPERNFVERSFTVGDLIIYGDPPNDYIPNSHLS